MVHVRTTWNHVALGGIQGGRWTHAAIVLEVGRGRRSAEQGRGRGKSGLDRVCMLKARCGEHQYSEVGPLRKLFDQKGSDLISRLILA